MISFILVLVEGKDFAGEKKIAANGVVYKVHSSRREIMIDDTEHISYLKTWK